MRNIRQAAKFKLWIAVFVGIDAAVVRTAGVLTGAAFTGGTDSFALCAALARKLPDRQFESGLALIVFSLLHVTSSCSVQPEMVGKNGARAYRQRDANDVHSGLRANV